MVWRSKHLSSIDAMRSSRLVQLDMVYDADIRQPSIHGQDLTWVTDYLIGCHNSSTTPPSRDNDLCVFAGSNE